jgi:succinoglycan biosynthesis transport protein ExoP
MDERAFHPLDYVSVLRRRKWWFLAPLAASIVAGVLLALLWPKEYISEAQIGVAAPTLAPELLRGVSSFDREERQRAISQQLLSREVLERVVRDEKLNPTKPVEDVAGWLRTRVLVAVDQPIGRNSDTRNALDSFKLGYVDPSPDRAQRITNRLAYVFVEENSKTQTERAENTSEVLLQQLQATQDRLATLETQLRGKKEANMGRLPDQIGANLAMANGLRQSFDSYSMQLRTEQDRLSQIESQIEEMRRGSATAPITSAAVSAIHGAQARINALQQQLNEELALGKTDKHPDVAFLRGEITTARAELQASKQADPNRGDLLLVDPIYRQRVQDRDAARLRVATLRAQSAQASAGIGAYQSRVEAAPMVEQDLSSVQREVELERIRYADLKKKHEDARLAEDLARKQGGERFSVLYPAYPGRPAKPGQQAKLVLIALALGFLFGAAMVVGREFLDRSVHDARALQSEFEIPVLGEIPRINGAA